MKKTASFLPHLIFTVLNALIFGFVTYNSSMGSLSGPIYFERTFYVFTGVTFVVCYLIFCIFTKSILKKILVGVTVSATYTTVVFLSNNLWRYIGFNSFFDWQDPISFTKFLIWDITYTDGYGEFRYPLLFIVIAVLCAVVIVLTTRKNKMRLKELPSRINNWFYKIHLEREIEKEHREAIKKNENK